MLADAKLMVARKLDQRLPLQDAAFVGAEVAKHLALEEKIAAVDPVIGEIRLLREFDNLVIFQF